MAVNIAELEDTARRMRANIINMSCQAQSAHIGSALSCVDIVTALYWSALRINPKKPDDPKRDRFIFSKGHAVAALYAALAMKGFFPEEQLVEFCRHGGTMGEHPIHEGAPGLEVASGSLGHGLPIGAGLALAARIQQRKSRVFVLMSDGECNEGSVWEAAMFAPAQNLGNLVAIVDFNKWQATGRTCEIMCFEPFRAKWKAFGWNTAEIDGHDMAALVKALRGVPRKNNKPLAIIAHTVKGKGVSFMEDDNNWHYKKLTEELKNDALKELSVL